MTTAYAIKCRTWGESRLCQEMLFARGFGWNGGHSRELLANGGEGLWIIIRKRHTNGVLFTSRTFEAKGILTFLTFEQYRNRPRNFTPVRIVDIAKWPKVKE